MKALLTAAEQRIHASGHSRAWLAVVPDNTRARASTPATGGSTNACTVTRPWAPGPVPVPCHRYVKQLAASPKSWASRCFTPDSQLGKGCSCMRPVGVVSRSTGSRTNVLPCNGFRSTSFPTTSSSTRLSASAPIWMASRHHSGARLDPGWCPASQPRVLTQPQCCPPRPKGPRVLPQPDAERQLRTAGCSQIMPTVSARMAAYACALRSRRT
jgi:hypothetical protein